ncbi:type IV pilin [Halorubrum sp. CBA1125]|uniref:type IV pilin n=1 Tax=Halorubrum sp. CBA1125 TaxID=2668072 RepID=UPI0012E7E4F3|nr:type IV pilin N-terminal domain-containing protein [Halorubrum sp. CBA1125]MUW14454.1 type IV pilin [Halorubrum sp. CBA1125]
MNTDTLFDADDRAVSPVIGVILMVAITVILAAVIGTFVLGLGDSLGTSQPTAQLSVSLDETADTVTIEHRGGDSIESDSLRVVVTAPADDYETSGTIGDRLSVGDSVTSASQTGNDTVGAGEDVRVRVIHQPSESILVDRTFEVTDGFDIDDGGDLVF